MRYATLLLPALSVMGTSALALGGSGDAPAARWSFTAHGTPFGSLPGSGQPDARDPSSLQMDAIQAMERMDLAGKGRFALLPAFTQKEHRFNDPRFNADHMGDAWKLHVGSVDLQGDLAEAHRQRVLLHRGHGRLLQRRGMMETKHSRTTPSQP